MPLVNPVARRGLHTRSRLAQSLAAAFLLFWAAHAAVAGEALWGIIQHCLRSSVEDYCGVCRSPLTTADCAASTSCLTSTQVWEQTELYLAMADRKSCGCADSFVHGLVLPLKRTEGIEDPQKPDGIWKYAWELGRRRIIDEPSIALVVNSPAYRSETQLHVHIVRLRKEMAPHIRTQAVALTSLDRVWDEARAYASRAGIGAVYGILVMRGPDSRFLMLVENTPLERLYTEYVCTNVPRARD